MRTLGPALQNLLMVREGGMGWEKKYKKGGQSILTFSRKMFPMFTLEYLSDLCLRQGNRIKGS